MVQERMLRGNIQAVGPRKRKKEKRRDRVGWDFGIVYEYIVGPSTLKIGHWAHMVVIVFFFF